MFITLKLRVNSDLDIRWCGCAG